MIINTKRLLSGLIDFCVTCSIGSVVFIFVNTDKSSVSIEGVIFYYVTVFVSTVCKDLWFKNASVGKKIFKLAIVKMDQTKLSFIDCLKRAISLLLLPLEILLVVINNRRLGDFWANTVVVDLATNKEQS